MLVDVGAGAMTASVFTMGRLAASQTLPYGLNRVDGLLIRALRAEQGLVIGQRTASELKHTLGSATPVESGPMRIAGIDTVQRLPQLHRQRQSSNSMFSITLTPATACRSSMPTSKMIQLSQQALQSSMARMGSPTPNQSMNLQRTEN